MDKAVAQFPLDILREVSLYLPHYFLSLSRESLMMYNESWFKDKVLFIHPKCKTTKFSWKDLYKRSLKQGRIYEYIEDEEHILFPIEGIKISDIDDTYYMILTFDQDLWICTWDGTQRFLVDTNVTDIDYLCYIKENELYSRIVNEIIKFESIFKAENNFIDIYYIHNQFAMCAITRDKLYCTSSALQHLKILDCVNNKNISVTSYHQSCIIQDHDGLVKLYDWYDNTIKELSISNVIKIYPGCAQLSNGSLIELRSDYKHNLTSKILLDNCDGLEQFCYNKGDFIMLINGNVYNKQKELICSDVKNIFGHHKNRDKFHFMYIK